MPDLTSSDVVRKFQRLGAMRPRELAHRVRAKLYSQLDRVGNGHPAAVPTPFKNYLAGAPGDRFYRSHRENLRAFVHEHFPQWIGRAVDEAEKLCRHEIALLGHGPVELGAEIDWHRDPVTGRRWERRFWADYRPAHDSGGAIPRSSTS